MNENLKLKIRQVLSNSHIVRDSDIFYDDEIDVMSVDIYIHSITDNEDTSEVLKIIRKIKSFKTPHERISLNFTVKL
jgi:hypothetical protein